MRDNYRKYFGRLFWDVGWSMAYMGPLKRRNETKIDDREKVSEASTGATGVEKLKDEREWWTKFGRNQESPSSTLEAFPSSRYRHKLKRRRCTRTNREIASSASALWHSFGFGSSGNKYTQWTGQLAPRHKWKSGFSRSWLQNFLCLDQKILLSLIRQIFAITRKIVFLYFFKKMCIPKKPTCKCNSSWLWFDLLCGKKTFIRASGIALIFFSNFVECFLWKLLRFSWNRGAYFNENIMFTKLIAHVALFANICVIMGCVAYAGAYVLLTLHENKGETRRGYLEERILATFHEVKQVSPQVISRPAKQYLFIR